LEGRSATNSTARQQLAISRLRASFSTPVTVYVHADALISKYSVRFHAAIPSQLVDEVSLTPDRLVSALTKNDRRFAEIMG